MVAIVPAAPTLEQEIRDLEQQQEDLQRKLDAAHESRSRTAQTAGDARVPRDRDLRRQRHLRKGILAYLGDYRLLVVFTAPVIYSTVFALVVLDVFLTLYQWICFPIYNLARVRRGDFIVIDRHLLGYLNVIEKLNCVFCGYANGVLAYSVEIASRTEQFWCPIKHAAQTKGLHRRTDGFADYTDGMEYRLQQRQNAYRTKHAACHIRPCRACRKQG